MANNSLDEHSSKHSVPYKEDVIEHYHALYDEPDELLEHLLQNEKHIAYYENEDDFLGTLATVKTPNTYVVLCSQGVSRSKNFRKKISAAYPEDKTPIKQLMLNRPAASMGVLQILDEMDKLKKTGKSTGVDLIFMHDQEFNELIEFMIAVANDKLGKTDPRLEAISIQEILRADFSKLGINRIFLVNSPHRN